MKKRNNLFGLVFMSSSLLLGAIGIGSFAGLEGIKSLNEKEAVNHDLDPDYKYVCSPTADLRKVEDETNMLPPDLMTSSVGSISLKPGRKMILNNEVDYTFIIFVSDNGTLDNAAAGNNYMSFSYIWQRGGMPASSTEIKVDGSGKTPAQFIAEASNENMNTLINSTTGMIRVHFRIPHDSDSSSFCYSVIDSFNVVFNANGDCGNVSKMQLIKGTDFRGYADFNHESCGIVDEMSGPYKTDSVVRVNVQYGRTDVTADNLRKTLLAHDVGDGKDHDVFIVEDHYTEHESELNVDLDIVFGSYDVVNNLSKITYRINVYDDVPPIVNQVTSDIKISYAKTLTEADILENFAISDNYVNGMGTIKTEGIDYSQTSRLPGSVPFKVVATDVAGNRTELSSSLTLIDDIAPSITGIDEVSVSAGDAVSSEELLSHFTSVDEIDGNCSLAVENDEYTKNSHTVGTYSLDVVSSDAAGNKATKTILVKVADTEGPVFYVNKTYLSIYGTQVLSSNEVVASLVRNGELPEKNYTYSEFVSGDYKDLKIMEEGKIYQASLAAYGEDGTTEYVDVTIESLAEKKEESVNLSFLERVGLFFKNIYQSLLSLASDII